MHIKKFTKEYTRRHFLRQVGGGTLAFGVLAPLWPTIAMGRTLEKVYPDEISSLEMLTNGKINTGDRITKDNVEYVKDLMDPVSYLQVSQMGREINTHKTTTDPSWLMPESYLDATVKNAGRAKFDEAGNVRTDDGSAWIGGNPFPEATTADEAFANITLSWGRYDHTFYAVKESDLNPDGSVGYDYEFAWVEMNATGRVTMGDKYYKNKQDVLRYQSVFFSRPQDVRGTAFLSIWPYDQRKFPALHGYLPAFKRVRRFPTNQRFEPILPGPTWYISDAWAAGDPFRTWGNFKVIHRGPMLGPAGPGNINTNHENWERERIGGPKGGSFFLSDWEVMPDVIVLEAEPVGYPRAPISKRRIYIDARAMVAFNGISYDRRGELFKSFEQGNGISIGRDGTEIKPHNGKKIWSWNTVLAHDVQSNRVSLIELAKSSGGYDTHYDDPNDYDRFLTVSAMRRLGR